MPEINVAQSMKSVMTDRDLSHVEGSMQQMNGISTSPYSDSDVSHESGKTLLDLFEDDVVSTAPVSKLSDKLDPLVVKGENGEVSLRTPIVQKSSFLDKILPWRWFKRSKDEERIGESLESDSRIGQGGLINHVPELEAPEGVVINSQELAILPKVSGYNSSKFSSAELAEALSSISDKTLGEIMTIVVKAQLKLEQDFAVVTDQLFDKNQSYVKTHQQMLEEVSEKLQKDIKWTDWSKKAQKVVFVVVAIASFAGAAATLAPYYPAFAGVLSAAAGSIATRFPRLAPYINNQNVVEVLKKFGDRGFRWSSAVMLGLASGTTKYLTWKSNQDSGRHEEVKHMLHRYEKRQESLRDHVASLAESDQQYKDYLSRELKRMKKLVKTINRQY